MTMFAQVLANNGFNSLAKKIVIIVKNFDAYPAEVLNQKATSSIGESRQMCFKTNKTSSSNPNCHFRPGFF